MMTIAKIEKDNLDYLFKHSTQEYFQGETQENEKGYFTGKLAEWQGLKGKEATKKEYDRLMSYNKDFKGVEIDPSPSKDWTNLYNRVSPEERKELTKIWNETMQDVAKAIEQNTYYRETKNGKTEYKLCKGAHIAIFNHHTARPVEGMIDGQEHSHIVIFPQVLGQDNKFHSHTLMDLKYEKNGHETLRYFDAVMNHGLAKGLNKLGYAVSSTKNGFTIDGMQENIRQEFSKRTNQINSLAGENATYADKKRISLKVRENKTQNNLTSLRADWQGKMDQLGFTSAEPLKSKQKDFDKSLSEISKEKGKNVFSNKELKTLALQQATFSNKTVEEKLKEFKQDKKLEYIGKNQNIFKSNFAMQKFTKLVKSNFVKSSLAKSKSLSSAKPSKTTPIPRFKVKNPKQKNFKNVGGSPVQSSGESVNEFLSDIKNLEQQLSSLKLDDPKRAQIESKIGDLKNKIKELMSEKVKNLTAKSATKENQKEQKELPQEEEEKEEKKEEKKQEKTLEEQAEGFSNELDKAKEHLANPKLEEIAQQAYLQAQQQAQQQIQQAQALEIPMTISG